MPAKESKLHQNKNLLGAGNGITWLTVTEL